MPHPWIFQINMNFWNLSISSFVSLIYSLFLNQNCPDPCVDYQKCVRCKVFQTIDLSAAECEAECGKHNITKTTSVTYVEAGKSWHVSSSYFFWSYLSACSYAFTHGPNGCEPMVPCRIEEPPIRTFLETFEFHGTFNMNTRSSKKHSRKLFHKDGLWSMVKSTLVILQKFNLKALCTAVVKCHLRPSFLSSSDDL